LSKGPRVTGSEIGLQRKKGEEKEKGKSRKVLTTWTRAKNGKKKKSRPGMRKSKQKEDPP